MEKLTPDVIDYLTKRIAYYEEQIDSDCELLAKLVCHKKRIEKDIADVKSNLKFEREVLRSMRMTVEEQKSLIMSEML